MHIKDRKLRSEAQEGDVSLHSLPEVSIESESASALLANASVNAAPVRRARDIYRTPDYTTFLHPNDPSRSDQRLLFVHELKRDVEDLPRADTLQKFELEVAFDNMAKQTLEQAQLALYNHKYLQSVFIMCHVGGRIRLLKYDRDATPPFGAKVEQPETIPVYKSKVRLLLNKNCTDFSSDFKRWWTTVKHGVCKGLDVPAAVETPVG